MNLEQLGQLAKALNSLGWKCEAYAGQVGMLFYALPDGGQEGCWCPDRNPEAPSLAFAMLDLFAESRGSYELRFGYPDDDEMAHVCRFEPMGDSWGECWQIGEGATKTGAVALALIAAHDAGLLKESPDA